MSVANARSDLELVARSLELSNHVIADDAGHLAGQFVGRLLESDRPAIQDLLADARRTRNSTWLCPTSAGLRSPGGPLVRTRDTPAVLLAIAPGGLVVSGGADGQAQVWDMGSAADPTLLDGSPLGLRRTTGSTLGDDGSTPVAVAEPAGVTAIAVLPSAGAVAVAYGDDHETIALFDVNVGTLTRTLVGRPEDRTSRLCDLVATSDGEQLLALSFDGTLRSWPLSPPGPVRTVTQVQPGATSMAIGPDAGWVVVALAAQRSTSEADRGPRTVMINVHTGDVIRHGPGLQQPAWGGEATVAPNRMAVAPDGRHIVSGFGDDHDTVLMWDVASPSPVRRFVGYPAGRGALESRGVSSLATTPDGAGLITGHNDGRILVWSIGRTDEPAQLPGHAGPVHDIAVTSDGNRIVSCGDDGIKLWDLDAAPVERAPAALQNTRALTGATVSANGDAAAVCSLHGEVATWSTSTGWSSLTVGRLAPSGMALTPDGSRLAVSGYGGLLVWGPKRDEEPVSIAAASNLQTVLMTDGGRWAATRARNGANGFDLWDLHRRVSIAQVPLDGDLWALCGLAEDGRIVVAADLGTGQVAEFDLRRRKVRVRRFETDLRSNPRIRLTAASVEAGRVLVISTDQRLSTWDLGSGLKILDVGTRGRAMPSETTDPYSPEAKIDPTAPWVATVAMTRDGRWAATGTSNGWIELWDLDHGELVADFRLDAPVLAVALDDDGGGVAALDESGAVIRLQRSLGLRSR